MRLILNILAHKALEINLYLTLHAFSHKTLGSFVLDLIVEDIQKQF